MKITGTIGGNRIGFIGARVHNGDLGPRRLLPGAAELFRPERAPEELTEADALARMADAQDWMEEEPDEPASKTTRLGADRIGALVVAWMAGESQEAIGLRLGVSQKSVSNKLRDIRIAVAAMDASTRGRRGGTAKRAHDGGRGKFRERRATIEQEREVMEMHNAGLGRKRIADEVGLSQGVVQHILRNPRVLA